MSLFRNLHRAALATALALPLSPLAAGTASAAPAVCYSDWSDAAPIVAREGLLASRELHMIARRQHASDVMRITLCREEAGYVYRLLLRDDHGRILSLKIDASGRPPALATSAAADSASQ